MLCWQILITSNGFMAPLKKKLELKSSLVKLLMQLWRIFNGSNFIMSTIEWVNGCMILNEWMNVYSNS